MAKEIDSKLVTKLAGIVKKEPGNSERFYSEKSGIPMGQILRYLVLAEIEADPSLKIPATAPAVAKARDEQGLRWPRIAARAGVTESRAKELYESKTGKSASDSYSGRGRNHTGAASTAKTSGTSGRRGAKTGVKTTASGTSGRRGAARGSTKKVAAASGRRGTRSSAKSDPK